MSSKARLLPPRLKFEKIAFVSTRHITKQDGIKLSVQKRQKNKPALFYCEPNPYCAIFRVPREETEFWLGELESAGYSKYLTDVLREAVKAKIDFVAFDADGDSYHWLSEFDW